MSRGIYNGRPHGGVSIAWSSDLDHLIKPLINFRHKRIVCVELSATPDPILFASIYMPFYDSSKRHECMAESRETITMLDEILCEHPLHKFVLGGDFNTEFTNSSPFDNLWRDFIIQHDLTLCFINSIFRKTFEYRQWESVTALQHALHRPTWEELVNPRRKKLRNSISENNFLSQLFY